MIPVAAGKNTATMQINLDKDVKQWSGKAEVWLVTQQESSGSHFTIESNIKSRERIMPPLPYKPGIKKEHHDLGMIDNLVLKK